MQSNSYWFLVFKHSKNGSYLDIFLSLIITINHIEMIKMEIGWIELN